MPFWTWNRIRMNRDKRIELQYALDRLKSWSAECEEIYNYILSKQSYFGIPDFEMWKIKKMYCVKETKNND